MSVEQSCIVTGVTRGADGYDGAGGPDMLRGDAFSFWDTREGIDVDGLVQGWVRE